MIQSKAILLCKQVKLISANIYQLLLFTNIFKLNLDKKNFIDWNQFCLFAYYKRFEWMFKFLLSTFSNELYKKLCKVYNVYMIVLIYYIIL